MSFVKGFAKGGKVNKTQTAWVSEEGPELLELPGGSRVHNNRDSMAMVSGPSSSPVIQFNNYVTIKGNADKEVVRSAITRQMQNLKGR